MAFINVVHSGIVEGTKNGKGYRFLDVQGILIDDNGEKRVGKMTFFQRDNKPLPVVTAGLTYEIVASAYVDREGRIQIGIDSLKEQKQGIPRPAAAA